MKKVSFFIAVFFVTFFAFSQEFAVKYDMTMESTEPEIQAQLSMVQGSTMHIYSKENKSRVETNTGSLMTTTVVTDSDNKKGVLLISGMLGKLAAPYGSDQFDEATEAAEDAAEVEIELIDETKEILGYICKKAIIYAEEEDVEMTYWYTEDFQPKDGSMGQFVRKEVPGLPLEFHIKQPQMTIKFVANELNTKVKKAKSLFDTSVPEGYTETSFDQLQGMLNGGL